MIAKQLNEKQKLILYGLVRYPELPDKEICKKFKIKKSTFSTIKSSFKEMGYFDVIRVPVFQHIGCELLIVVYGRLNRRTKLQDRLNVSKTFLDMFHEYFYILSESNQAINFAISKNITDFERNFEEFIHIYESNNFLDEDGFQHVIFPFELTSIFNFFDYTSLLNHSFNLGFKDEITDINLNSEKIRSDVKTTEFSDMEKKIFNGLVKYPEFSDNSLAEKLSTTRITVKKFRTKFYEEKLLSTKVIPDVKKIGFNILAFTHSKFKPQMSIKNKEECLKITLNTTPTIFYISRKLESMSMTVFENFKDYQSTHDLINKCRTEKDFLKGEPLTILLSVPTLSVIKNHVYAPLTKKIVHSL
jgi:hypothetical protein